MERCIRFDHVSALNRYDIIVGAVGNRLASDRWAWALICSRTGYVVQLPSKVLHRDTAVIEPVVGDQVLLIGLNIAQATSVQFFL